MKKSFICHSVHVEGTLKTCWRRWRSCVTL